MSSLSDTMNISEMYDKKITISAIQFILHYCLVQLLLLCRQNNATFKSYATCQFEIFSKIDKTQTECTECADWLRQDCLSHTSVFEWHKKFSEGCQYKNIMKALDDLPFIEPKKMQINISQIVLPQCQLNFQITTELLTTGKVTV